MSLYVNTTIPPLTVSHFTKQLLRGDYIFRFLDLVTVKGKNEPVEIWQIHDYNMPLTHSLYTVSKESLEEELLHYHEGIAYYKKADFQKALAIFETLDSREHKTNQAIYGIYIERCQHYIHTPPVNFNGVFVHTHKG